MFSIHQIYRANLILISNPLERHQYIYTEITVIIQEVV